ncbi:MAG: DUF1127 domain-containing protein [Pseudomonadota bacterium]
METAHLIPSRPAFTAAQSLWSALLDDVRLYRRYRKTLKQLQQLEDHELADLSPIHKNAKDLAFVTVYGKPKLERPTLVWSQ